MLYSFFKSVIMGFSIPLGMLVAKFVPTPFHYTRAVGDHGTRSTPPWLGWLGLCGPGVLVLGVCGMGVCGMAA